MAAVMIELTRRPDGDGDVVLVDDVEELGAYARCSCAASDAQLYKV